MVFVKLAYYGGMFVILIILALLFGNLFLNQKRQDKLEDYKRKLAEKDKK